MDKKLKSLLILPTTLLILTGCFGGNGGGTGVNIPDAGETKYEHSDFSIIIPQDWEIIEKSDFTSNVPYETIVGFRNNIKSEIFTANVNIAMTGVTEETTSADLAKSSRSKISSSLLSFQELASKKIDFQYGETNIEAATLEFSGKKGSADPITQFNQLYVVTNGIGYIVTASYLPDEDETVVKYTNRMIDSFTLK